MLGRGGGGGGRVSSYRTEHSQGMTSVDSIVDLAPPSGVQVRKFLSLRQ